MSERVCDSCGKEKNVQGGKTCENGHFICKDCIYSRISMFDSAHKVCPLDNKPLR